jgi:hypothetical protein
MITGGIMTAGAITTATGVIGTTVATIDVRYQGE